MEIPLPDLMRAWRERDFVRGNPPRRERLLLKAWAFAAKRPRLYHALANRLVPLLAWLARGSGSIGRLPFGKAWTRTRDFPAPEGKTFHTLYAEKERSQRR
jgi:L-lactate dehydrogenase complex protein LldF